MAVAAAEQQAVVGRETEVVELVVGVARGGALGMQTLDSCLKGLLAKGLISRDSAKEKAKQPENF